MENTNTLLKEFIRVFSIDKGPIDMFIYTGLERENGMNGFKIVNLGSNNIAYLKYGETTILELNGDKPYDRLTDLNTQLKATNTTGGKRRTLRHKKNKKSRKNRRKTYHRRR